MGTDGVIRSVQINAPKDGYLMMVASSQSYNGTTSDGLICYLTLDAETLSSSARWSFPDPPNTPSSDCNTDSAWPVARGFHTVTFQAEGLDTNTRFDMATLEVMFVPFDGTGAVPTPVAPT